MWSFRVAMLAVLAALALPAAAPALEPPQVAVGTDGGVAVGWTDAGTVRVDSVTPGAPATPPVVLADDGADVIASIPRGGVSRAPDGSVRVVWLRPAQDLGTPAATAGIRVFAARVLADGTVRDEQALSPPQDDPPFAGVATRPDGSAIVAWGGPSPGVAVAAPGGPFATDDAAPRLKHPAVALGADGSAVLAGDDCPSDCVLRVHDRSPAGAWGPAARLEPVAGGTWSGGFPVPDRTAVALGDDGAVTVGARGAGPTAEAPLLLAHRASGAATFTVVGRPVIGSYNGLAAVPGFVVHVGGVVAVGADGFRNAGLPGSGTDNVPPALVAAGDGTARAFTSGLTGAEARTVGADGTVGPAAPLGTGSQPASAPSAAASGTGTAVAWLAVGGRAGQAVRLATTGLPGIFAQADLATIGQETSGRQLPRRLRAVEPRLELRGGRLARRDGHVAVPVSCREFCRGSVRVTAAGRTRSARFANQGGTRLVQVAVRRGARRGRVVVRLRSGRSVRATRAFGRRAATAACGVAAWATVLARGDGARVTELRNGRTGLVRTRLCVRGRDRTAWLGEDARRGGIFGADVAGGVLTVAQTRVLDDGYGTRYGVLRRIDLRTGATSRVDATRLQESIGAGTELLAFETVDAATTVFMDGAVPANRARLRVIGPGRDAVLDTAPGIDPASLAYADGIVTYRRAGQPVSVALTP